MTQDPNVPRIARMVGAATLAAALGACGLISGLGDYKSGPCTVNCDGGAPLPDAHATIDATMDTGSMTMTEASSDDGPGDDAEAGPEAGCATTEIECGDAGCVDPSTPANCGSCGNACGADADLCAASEEGGFACTTVCPGTTVNCGMSCVDTTSDPTYCGGCDNAPCTTSVAHASPTCTSSVCGFACDTNYTLCAGTNTCVNQQTDSNNCGGCGAAFVCGAGTTCVGGTCQTVVVEAGAPDTGADVGTSPPMEAGAVEAGPPACPAGGCPNSTTSGWSACPFGTCNGGAVASTCNGGGVCVCTADGQCKSDKCVKVTGENDMGCGASGCSGTGTHDGFDCELVTPGIPVPSDRKSVV